MKLSNGSLSVAACDAYSCYAFLWLYVVWMLLVAGHAPPLRLMQAESLTF
jgi:hypothetical protein